MRHHHIVQVIGRRREMADIVHNPVGRRDSVIGNRPGPAGAALRHPDIAGIDHPGRPVGEGQESAVSLPGCEAVDIQVAFLPRCQVPGTAGGFRHHIGPQRIGLLRRQGQDMMLPARTHVAEAFFIDRNRHVLAYPEQLGMQHPRYREDIPRRTVVRHLLVGLVRIEYRMRPLRLHGRCRIHHHFPEFEGILVDGSRPLVEKFPHGWQIVHHVELRPLFGAVTARHDGKVFHLARDELAAVKRAVLIRRCIQQLRQRGGEAQRDDHHAAVFAVRQEAAVTRYRIGEVPVCIVARSREGPAFHHRHRIVARLVVFHGGAGLRHTDLRVPVPAVQDVGIGTSRRAVLVNTDHLQVYLAVANGLIRQIERQRIIDIIAQIRFNDNGNRIRGRLSQNGFSRKGERSH